MYLGGNQHVTMLEIFLLDEPTMTPAPAAWQALIIFAYWARVSRLNVREYETGWYSTHRLGSMDVLLCRAHWRKVNIRRAIRI